MLEIVTDALAFAEARNWGALRLVLHRYLHWSADECVTLRGRANVLHWLATRQRLLAPPQHVELRDGQTQPAVAAREWKGGRVYHPLTSGRY